MLQMLCPLNCSFLSFPLHNLVPVVRRNIYWIIDNNFNSAAIAQLKDLYLGKKLKSELL
jgi:hypothetical protein